MDQTVIDRQDRTGARQPVFNAPPVVFGLIAVLVGVHLVLFVAGDAFHVWALYSFAFIPARLTVEGFPMLPGAQAWSFLSYAFLHGDWLHLLFNCLWLLVFGTPAARYLGAGRFLLVATIAAVAGAFGSLLVHWGQVVFVLGASGAVSGLLATAIPLMYGRRVIGGFRPLSARELVTNGKALTFMGIWLAITLFSGAAGWTGNSFTNEAGIAWEAHLGGFAGGLAAFYLLARRWVP